RSVATTARPASSRSTTRSPRRARSLAGDRVTPTRTRRGRYERGAHGGDRMVGPSPLPLPKGGALHTFTSPSWSSDGAAHRRPLRHTFFGDATTLATACGRPLPPGGAVGRGS